MVVILFPFYFALSGAFPPGSYWETALEDSVVSSLVTLD